MCPWDPLSSPLLHEASSGTCPHHSFVCSWRRGGSQPGTQAAGPHHSPSAGAGQRACGQTPASGRPLPTCVPGCLQTRGPGGSALSWQIRGSEPPTGLRPSGNRMGSLFREIFSHTHWPAAPGAHGTLSPPRHPEPTQAPSCSLSPAGRWASSGCLADSEGVCSTQLPAATPPGSGVGWVAELSSKVKLPPPGGQAPPGIRLGGRGSSPRAACSLGGSALWERWP